MTLERCGRPTTKGTPCIQWKSTGWLIPLDSPRPPACRWHLTREERAELDRRAAEYMAEGQRLYREMFPCPYPLCWNWAVTAVDRDIVAHADEWKARYVLRDWQRSRCAACGHRAEVDLLLDHDHETGLIRGWLCRSCNTSEPHGDELYLMYRKKNPASILGINARYWSPFRGWARPAPPPPSLADDPAHVVAAAMFAPVENIRRNP